jgi:hypothetical protein
MPINYFMGIMAKSKYFSRPDGYQSPEEVALRRRNEDMRRKAESLKQLQEEGLTLAFETWFNALTGNEMNALTPKLIGIDAKKAHLRQRFRDEFGLRIRDNPSVDLTSLRLKVPTEQELIRQDKRRRLEEEILDYEEILRKHPRDADTAQRLAKCRTELTRLGEREELTPEQVKAIADAQFGNV